MKKFNFSLLKNTGLLLSTTLLCTFGLSTSYADDTEIFTVNQTTNFKNNIMLMFDTSGSMRRHVTEFSKVDLTTEDITKEDGSLKTVAELALEFPDKYNPAADYDGDPLDVGCGDNVAYYANRSTDGGDSWFDAPSIQYDGGAPRGECRNVWNAAQRQQINNGNLEPFNDFFVRPGTDNPGIKISALDCAAARTALTTVGHFQDAADENGNFACTNTVYRDRQYYSGHFMEFTRSRVDQTTFIPLSGWDAFYSKSRLQIIQNVMGRILTNQDASGQPRFDVNIGMMRFDSDGDSRGAEVITSIRSIQDPSIANSELAKINALTPDGGTPLQESLLEIYRYFSGGNAVYNSGDSDPTAFELDEDGNRTNTYISPITHACQKNSLLFLTDGFASADTGQTTAIEALTGNDDCNNSGECMADIARYMYLNDLITTNLPGPADQQGEQKVETTAVGFVVRNDDFLKVGSETEGGGGGFVQANNTAEIEEAFTDTIQSVSIGNSTFTSPAVSVSSYNRLTNRNELYFTMFDPVPTVKWDGNLKQYQLASAQITNNAGATTLSAAAFFDANGSIAVNPDNGIFYDLRDGAGNPYTTQSFWSSTPDGSKVTDGGFANRLQGDENIAPVYTTLVEPAPGSTTPVAITTRLKDLVIPDEDLKFTGTADEKQELLLWGAGFEFATNADGTPNTNIIRPRSNPIGAPLHSAPVTITYGVPASATADPETAIFFGTNNGFIHAVNAFPSSDSAPMDFFSYIPKDLIPNLVALKANGTNSTNTPIYGIDGPISSFIKESNSNGILETNLTGTNAEKAYIYATMRRGGKNIYALDVTNQTAPKLQWVIKSGDPGFEKLGQTWSRATPAKVRFPTPGSSTPIAKDVLIFGGGYDPDQDAAAVRTTDTEGNAVYMVDAETGALLWSVSNSDSSEGPSSDLTAMNYSIPSDISVLDLNNDGFADRLYFGDMGGQIWRFDFNQFENNSGNVLNSNLFAVGDVIANIAGDDADDSRRIYYKPSAAIVTDDVFGTYLALAFGTGFRANPASNRDIQDRFYTIKELDIFPGFERDSAGTLIRDYPEKTNFVNITDRTEDLFLSDLSANTLIADLRATEGFYLDLGTLPNSTGEKVLANSLIADNKLYFTTYVPPEPGVDSCDPSTALGDGRLYSLNLLSGGLALSAADLNELQEPNNTVLADNSIETELNRAGIPPAPILVFSEPNDGNGNNETVYGEDNCNTFSQISLVVATQVENPNICNRPARTYWNERDDKTEPPAATPPPTP